MHWGQELWRPRQTKELQTEPKPGCSALVWLDRRRVPGSFVNNTVPFDQSRFRVILNSFSFSVRLVPYFQSHTVATKLLPHCD